MLNVLDDLIKKIVGLECIIIADRDGIPIIKAGAQKIPETVLRSGFLSTFGMAQFQGKKLGMGENNTTISLYTSYQVVQMDLQGMIVTFIGKNDCNIGQILSVSKTIAPALLELQKVLEQS
ncbi:unnamed protein product [Nezara viridula]|uniref:Uncharacterized protein n=1 Tax=Nezara viridula TaxID=85310 RepID=A0A9P0HNW7_NEZVI|nr:unnamed protein product [Nezara viridula]